MTIYHLYDLETGEYRGSGTSDYASVPGVGSTTVDPGILARDTLPPTWTGTRWERADPDGTNRALKVAMRLVVTPTVLSGELDGLSIASLAPLYDPWEPGEVVAPGDLRRWGDSIAECLQAHETSEGLDPDQAPELWKLHGTTP